MTHMSAPLSVRKYLPYLLILKALPLLGCNLINGIADLVSGSDAMSLEETLTQLLEEKHEK